MPPARETSPLEVLVRRSPGCFGPEAFEFRVQRQADGSAVWTASLQDERTTFGATDRLEAGALLALEAELSGSWPQAAREVYLVSGPAGWFVEVQHGTSRRSRAWTGGEPGCEALEAWCEGGVVAAALRAVERRRDEAVRRLGAWTSLRLPGGRPERLAGRLQREFPDVEFGSVSGAWLELRAPGPRLEAVQARVDELARRWSR